MKNKIQYLVIGLFLVIVLSQLVVSGGSSSLTINMDRSGWDYEKYSNCGAGTACSSPTLEEDDYESSYSHTFYYNTDKNAVWLFEECYRPKVIVWSSCGSCGNIDVNSEFNKKDNCISEFNSLTISDSTPSEGDVLDVNVNIDSAFTISDDSPGLPYYWPASHNDWYTSEITVTAVVKKSSSVVMTLPSQLVLIYQDDSDDLTFEIDTTGLSAGTYTVYVTTQCSDCICDQSNDIPVTQTVSFTIEEEEYECDTDSDCGNNGFVDNDYCFCNDLYQDYREYTCHNPGTPSAYCDYEDSPIFQEDCGENEIINGDDYCVGDDVYYNKTIIDRGCLVGSCFEFSSILPMFVEECAYDCVQGECVGECEDDNDCGEDEIVNSDNFCIGEDVYYNKTIIDRGCSSGFCFEDSDTLLMFVEECAYDCVQGECVDECEDDGDCGDDEVINSEDYCVGKDIYYNMTFINRGCSSGFCFEEILTDEIFVEHCAYDCFQGECVGECEDDGDCNDGTSCNGVETCNLVTHTCQSGTPVDCSIFDINPISTCSYIPDGNSFTFDFFAGFDSECNELTASCTMALCWEDEITHECDISECGAECEIDEDCTEGNNGICLDNCSCEYSDVERCGPDNQGILFDGYCWYEGDEYYQNCDEICGEHLSVCIQPPVQNDCSLHAYLGINCNPHWCVGDDLFAPAYQWECQNCYYNFAGNYSCSTSGNYYRICACEVGEEESFCGDGIIDLEEACDEGIDNGNVCSPEYENNCDYCSESCEIITLEGAYCGDDILNLPYEECDDGDNDNNDGCSSDCEIEDDDDDNHKNGKGSKITYLGYDEPEISSESSYSLSFCGNNVTEASEDCDDGNYVSGDGCSMNCQFETLGEQDNSSISLINILLILGILLLIFLVILIAILRS